MRFSSLRVKLQLLVWVAIIPVLFLIIGGSIWYRHHEETKIRDEVVGLVSLSKNGLDRYVNDTRQLLLTISHTDVIKKGNSASISAFFRDMHHHFPEHTNFGAVDLKGNVFASAVPFKKPVNASDMFWFQQTLKTRDFTIGEYQIGRVTGLEVIVFGQPVFDRAGNMKSVLFAAMDRSWLNRFWPVTKLSPDSHFIITDRNGTVLFHYPDTEKWTGKNKAEMPLVKAMLTQKEGSSEAECDDGIKRIYAFTGMGTPGSNIHIAIGISKKVAFEQINKILIINLISLALVTLAGVLLARMFSRRFILKPINTLHDAASRFASGDYTSRTNLSDGDNEIIAFANVFDKMAETIGQEITMRKKAEELLRKTGDKNQAMIDAIPDLMFRISRDGVFLEYKPAEGMDTYMPPSEFLGNNIQQVMPREFAQQTLSAIDQTLQTGRMQVFEYQLIMKGEERSYEARIISCGKDEVLAIVRDTTERKKAEEQIRILAAIVNIAPAAIITLNPEGAVTAWNKTAERIFGWSEEEAIGKRNPIVPEDKLEEFQATRKKVMSGESFFDIETQRQRKDGSRIEVSFSSAPMLDAKGNIIGIIALVLDITSRKKSDVLIKNILESIEEGFIIIDPEYRIISANRAYCKQVKSPDCEIIGRHCYEVSHHLGKPCFMADEECAPSHTFKTGVPHMAMHTHYDKEGNPVYVETKSYAMKDSSGNIYAVIETLNNVTEKRTLEEQLRHAQKMEAIGTLAGGIAHDFNNLLNVIIGYGGLMQLRMKPDDPQMGQLKEILAAGDRAAQLTKGLLTFSRKQVMETRTVNLNMIVEGFKKMLTRIIGEDIDLKITIFEKDLTVKGDVVQLEQVLMNLAVNARDAMPKGGTLAIETRSVKIGREFIKTHSYGEPSMYALITVSDTGIGMDEKTRERIFEPYFTTKEMGRGTGLGLAIIYGIVTKHNGYVHCYSEPGKGTTFRIYIPLVKSAAEKLEKEEAVAPEGGAETILIAEDDASVRGLIKLILEGYGYTVIEAVDGNDAVRKFRDNKDKIQLLLSDLIMPGKNGKDAYEDIKAIRHDIRAIFISGYARDIIQRFGIEDGIEFISKPVLPTELIRKVREELDK